MALLDSASVLVHPYVIGEIACGSLADRETVIELLRALPSSAVADPEEVLVFIDRLLVTVSHCARPEKMY